MLNTVQDVLLLLHQFIQSDDNESWRVSPITWMVATILGLFATFYVLSDFRGWFSIPLDLRLLSLAATYVILILGVLTNEA